MDKCERERERECFNEVEQEAEDGQSIVHDILQKCTDFFRRIIVPVEGAHLPRGFRMGNHVSVARSCTQSGQMSEIL